MSFPFDGKTSSFLVRDCAFISIATGYTARNLVEFRDLLKMIPAESIYHLIEKKCFVLGIFIKKLAMKQKFSGDFNPS